MAGADHARAALDRLERRLNEIVLGKPETIRLALIALVAEGHLLLEDVPGVGKTLLAKALARSIGGHFSRIQFTPDLLPGDLLGVSIFFQKTGEFVFQPGPIFAPIILADEVNRATPRTQSALLEAMAERQVTIEGQTRKLGPPFFVVATQNPYEFEGTYALPESQLDRFLIRTSIGYPSRQADLALLEQHRGGEPVDTAEAVATTEDVTAWQGASRDVTVSKPVAEYMLDIVEATREHNDVTMGVSTRGLLAFYRAVQASALLEGRDYSTPDDVQKLCVPVLAHRMLLKGWTQANYAQSATLLQALLTKIAVR